MVAALTVSPFFILGADADGRWMANMNTRQISFALQELVCPRCAIALEQSLSHLEGIIAANVNYATECANVLFDPRQVSLEQIAHVVRDAGFGIAQQRITLSVEGLLYVSSARTVVRVLKRVDGVIRAVLNFKMQQIELEVIAGQVDRQAYGRALATLGLRVVEDVPAHSFREFAARGLTISVLTVSGFWSAGAHAGWWDAGIWHLPLVVMGLAIVLVYGLGGRFYRMAFETALHYGEFDSGVMTALVAIASLFLGLPVALMVPPSIWTTSGFLVAMGLTAGWFIVRGMHLWLALQNNPKLYSAVNPTALGIILHHSHR